jgi:hypothetical protein
MTQSRVVVVPQGSPDKRPLSVETYCARGRERLACIHSMPPLEALGVPSSAGTKPTAAMNGANQYGREQKETEWGLDLSMPILVWLCTYLLGAEKAERTAAARRRMGGGQRR